MRTHDVEVGPLPSWLDTARLLGEGAWRRTRENLGRDVGYFGATLPREAAADVQARLRKLVLDGRPVAVTVAPALSRSVVRAARTRDAQRRRDTTPGFVRKGTRLDDEARWSLTPHALALRMGEAAAGRDVLDAGCGGGGNAIGFAAAGCRVVAWDLDEQRVAQARHNARVHGVADRCRFVVGDAREAMATEDAELLFIDPPWGTDWSREGVGLHSFPLLQAALEHARRFERVWAKLPPSFATEGVREAAGRVGRDVRVSAVFGDAAGDRRRVKFVWLSLVPATADGPRSVAQTRPER